MAQPMIKVEANGRGSFSGLSTDNVEDADEDDLHHSVAYSKRESVSAAERARRNLNARLANPLAGMSHETLMRRGEHYARRNDIGDEDDVRAFKIGAVLAQDPEKFEQVEGIHEDEMTVLRKEFSSRWSQPPLMYLVIVLCSTCAAVQGMDETVVNGAQIFYTKQFGISEDATPGPRATWLTGLLNGAPYLCCAFIGCWLTVPFNHWFGRRGTIFVTCLISALACFWQGFVGSWWHMFIARFVLGLGIGPKSATVPIYAVSESLCACHLSRSHTSRKHEADSYRPRRRPQPFVEL
jgi:Sugar (and other) transporter